MKNQTGYPDEALSIGQASQLTGLSARSIRHYEAIGIIGRASRAVSGYRRFSNEDLRTLQFVRNARSLHFDLKEIGRMVECWRDGTCPDAEIVSLLDRRVAKLLREETQLRNSRSLLAEIQSISTTWPRQDCGIVSMLAGDSGPLADHATADQMARKPRQAGKRPPGGSKTSA